MEEQLKQKHKFYWSAGVLCLGLLLCPLNEAFSLGVFAFWRAPFRDFNSMTFPEGALVDMGHNISLVMQADGNFVMYGPSGVLWASGTSRSCNLQCEGVFQTDGNLVLYFNGAPFWSTGTSGTGLKLRVSAVKSNIQIIDNGAAVWSGN